MRTLLSFICLFVLAGCGYFTNPGAMPAGYKYHGTTYNARPGPEVRDSKKTCVKENCAEPKSVETEIDEIIVE